MNRDQLILSEAYRYMYYEQAAPPAQAAPAVTPGADPAVIPPASIDPSAAGAPPAEVPSPIDEMMANVTPDQIPDLLAAIAEMLKMQMAPSEGAEGAPPVGPEIQAPPVQ